MGDATEGVTLSPTTSAQSLCRSGARASACDGAVVCAEGGPPHPCAPSRLAWILRLSSGAPVVGVLAGGPKPNERKSSHSYRRGTRQRYIHQRLRLRRSSGDDQGRHPAFAL